jgi:hypothetical protein
MNFSKHLSLFKSMGTFIAKSILDSRIVDMPFSDAFLSILVNVKSLKSSRTTLSKMNLLKVII